MEKTALTFCECYARDGLQSMPIWVPTEKKIEMINMISEAGFPKLEVTSFSHPKLLPQFRDCVEVLQQIKRKPGTSYVVLMPNEKGFERFLKCQKEGYGADEIILMISSSEAHNTLNFRLTHTEAFKVHARIMEEAIKQGVKVIGCTGTVYGCPVGGDVPYSVVHKVTKFYVDHGADTLMLGDTTGVANPNIVKQRLGQLISDFPNTKFIAHFHDTRGTGVVNTLTAIEMGVTYVDTSIGAIGGQPASGASKYSLGFTGNTCSEDMVALVEEMGYSTGVDMDLLLKAGHFGEELLDMRLRGNVTHSGPVLHQPSTPDKGSGEKIKN